MFYKRYNLKHEIRCENNKIKTKSIPCKKNVLFMYLCFYLNFTVLQIAEVKNESRSVNRKTAIDHCIKSIFLNCGFEFLIKCRKYLEVNLVKVFSLNIVHLGRYFSIMMKWKNFLVVSFHLDFAY